MTLPPNPQWDATVQSAQEYLAQIDEERDEEFEGDAARERERQFPRYPDLNDPRR